MLGANAGSASLSQHPEQQHSTSNQPVVVTNSNEYLSALKTSDPLVHNIKCKFSLSLKCHIELCGEIDAHIEESTGLLYEEDLNQALIHMQVALKKLNVGA